MGLTAKKFLDERFGEKRGNGKGVASILEEYAALKLKENSMITRAINRCFERQDAKGWGETYWFFDLHDTVIVPNYNTEGEIPTEFYDGAEEVLRMISNIKDIKMIMYTCSHPEEIEKYIELFESKGIHFDYINENPEVKTDKNGYGCYDQKPYMNVLFEDKAGFDAETEWSHVKEVLINRYGADIVKNESEEENSNL